MKGAPTLGRESVPYSSGSSQETKPETVHREAERMGSKGERKTI